MGAKNRTKLSKIAEHRLGLEPRPTAEMPPELRVRPPCRETTSAYLSVGSEGLEPSPTWLRARRAAANTLIPSFVVLSAEPAVGAEGIEPSTWSL